MESLLLLHGAIGASDQLQPLASLLKRNYQVHFLNFSGHGGRGIPETFSIQRFAEDVLLFMEEHGLEQVNIFGYSMGGYVGMYLAKYFPEKMGKLITLATKFHWDEAIAEKEMRMLDADKIEIKLPEFAKSLEQRHAPNNWKDVLKKTAAMLLGLGRDNALKAEDYPQINTECLLMLGDRDKMITLEETVAVYQSLPKAQMAMLPATPHPIEQTDAKLLAFFIERFLGKVY